LLGTLTLQVLKIHSSQWTKFFRLFLLFLWFIYSITSLLYNFLHIDWAQIVLLKIISFYFVYPLNWIGVCDEALASSSSFFLALLHLLFLLFYQEFSRFLTRKCSLNFLQKVELNGIFLSIIKFNCFLFRKQIEKVNNKCVTEYYLTSSFMLSKSFWLANYSSKPTKFFQKFSFNIFSLLLLIYRPYDC